MSFVFLSHSPPCFLSQGLLLSLELTVRLGQVVIKSLLSLLPQNWDYSLNARFFMWVLRTELKFSNLCIVNT